MNTHDPREHIRGIHQILISDKKRIGFLFGAGSSYATGLPTACIPAIEKMTKTIVEEVGAHSAAFGAAIKEIKTETELGKVVFNIESLLSSIEAKRAVIGAGKLNGLDGNDFSNLAKFVKTCVVKLVSVHESIKAEDRKKLAHARLANWVQKARRRFPAEIFTTNYDYLFEIALKAQAYRISMGFLVVSNRSFVPRQLRMSGIPSLGKALEDAWLAWVDLSGIGQSCDSPTISPRRLHSHLSVAPQIQYLEEAAVCRSHRPALCVPSAGRCRSFHVRILFRRQPHQ